MSNPIKATKAIIHLGDIELDVYRLPNGDYAMSQNGCKTLDILIGDSTGKKYAKPLLLKDNLSGELTKIEGTNASARLMRLDTFSQIVLQYAKLGNQKCQAIVFACFAESLERRADSAFGIARSEEERNVRLEARRKGKVTRRTLTDAIQAWVETNNPLDNYRKWIYANCTDRINLAIFGAKASKLKAKLDIKQIRDACNAKQIKELDLIEELICREIEEGGLEPLEATKFVLATQRVRSLPFV